jgi:hypothetical protein
MPEATAAALVAEERQAVADMQARPRPAVIPDDDFSDDENEAEIRTESRQKCMDWLVENFDDARLLSSSYHSDESLPLTFKLAQKLAPLGAILELWVVKVEDPQFVWGVGEKRPRYGAPGGSGSAASAIDGATVREQAWQSFIVIDVTSKVVYSLDQKYFSRHCPSAHELATERMNLEQRFVRADSITTGGGVGAGAGLLEAAAEGMAAEGGTADDVPHIQHRWVRQKLQYGASAPSSSELTQGRFLDADQEVFQTFARRVCARRWCKDGGINRGLFAWLRCRKDIPVTMIKNIQTYLGMGHDAIAIPEWLKYKEWPDTDNGKCRRT